MAAAQGERELTGLRFFRQLSTNYEALGPNCTTVSAGIFRSAFPSLSLDTDVNGGRLGMMEKGALFFHGTPDHVFMPLDLELSLDRQVQAGAASKTKY